MPIDVRLSINERSQQSDRPNVVGMALRRGALTCKRMCLRESAFVRPGIKDYASPRRCDLIVDRSTLQLIYGHPLMKKSRGRCTRSNRSRRQSRRFKLEVLESRLCLAAAPAFESLPGADHTILLDFDGHVVENTNWNSYYNQATLTANPYDIDGNPSTFNATELSRIEEAFNRVAEDFRPFNVNVTTVEPSIDRLQKSGSGDTQWGLRVIVTKESTMVNDPAEYCGCGGIAYINSFNNSGDLPVWVYTSGGKSVAEAASHEVGHALGLSHDGNSSSSYYQGHGSGDTGWASIMGVGYYKNVTQWDDGTFYDSNNGGSGANYNKGPDDLHVITTYNGFGYRADDHGDTNGAASLLSVSGTTVNDAGLIEQSTDQDVFTFTTGAGSVTLNVNSFLPGPNLDIQADLYDGTGTLVATSNPTSGLNASISATLAAGQYYLHIDGVGVGDPTSSTPTGYSDYASLGSYQITGSIVDPGQVAQLSINDVIVDESAGTATFTVTRSGSTTGDVTVSYSTIDGSASAPGDFEYTAGSLTFTDGGSSSQTIRVPIVDDVDAEGVESFTVNLSNATGGTIADGEGTATINDNDANVSISDASANEGNLTKGKNGGDPTFKDIVFVVNLSNSLSHDVTISWSTANGTAVAGSDYVAASDVLTISAGQTSGTITVQSIGDGDQEPDETFFVNIDSVDGASLLDGQATGSILDDDTKGGGGGGGGNGNGNGKPKKSATDELLVVDELWYFEEHSHDHDHDAHHDDGLAAAIALIAEMNESDQDNEMTDTGNVQLVDEAIKVADFGNSTDTQNVLPADQVDVASADSSEQSAESAADGMGDFVDGMLT